MMLFNFQASEMGLVFFIFKCQQMEVLVPCFSYGIMLSFLASLLPSLSPLGILFKLPLSDDDDDDVVVPACLLGRSHVCEMALGISLKLPPTMNSRV